ncbi:MAG: hypothetical protein ACK56F_08070, partial [bacterium]
MSKRCARILGGRRRQGHRRRRTPAREARARLPLILPLRDARARLALPFSRQGIGKAPRREVDPWQIARAAPELLSNIGPRRAQPAAPPRSTS